MLGIPLTVAVSVCAVCLLVQGDVRDGLVFIGLALPILAASVFFLIWNSRVCRAEQQRVESAGEVSVWPFISGAALESVRDGLKLLPAATPPCQPESEINPS